MKTIGMLGGMSWESTLSYYKALNQGVKTALGGLHSAKICMVSVDFDEIEKLQHKDDWTEMTKILSDAAMAVQSGGADFLMICTNTMHKVAPQIAKKLSIPILHIADATAEKLVDDSITCVGLLGTKFTMEQDFYKGRLRDDYNIRVITPDAESRGLIHKVIYSELCLGNISESSRMAYLNIINELYAKGAQAIILGCTEIALLVQQRHTRVALYDTTEIHAAAAVKLAVSE